MAGDIIHQYRARRAPIVRPRHRPEPFRARGIPKLEFDSLPPCAGTDFDDLGGKLDADSLGG